MKTIIALLIALLGFATTVVLAHDVPRPEPVTAPRPEAVTAPRPEARPQPRPAPGMDAPARARSPSPRVPAPVPQRPSGRPVLCACAGLGDHA